MCSLLDLPTDMASLDLHFAVNGTLSMLHTPLEGMPQGSVIGPLCVTMYTAPLENIIHTHGLCRMICADNNQVFIVLDDESDRTLLIP